MAENSRRDLGRSILTKLRAMLQSAADKGWELLKKGWGVWNVFVSLLAILVLIAVTTSLLRSCGGDDPVSSDASDTSISMTTTEPSTTSTTVAVQSTTTSPAVASSTVAVSIAASPSPQTTVKTVVETTIARRAKTTTTPPTTAPVTTIAATTTVPPTTTTSTIAGRIVTFDFVGTWSAAEKSATIDTNKNNDFSLQAVNTSAWTAVLPDGTTTFTFRMYRYLNAWYTANPGSGDSNHPTNYAASSTNATCNDGGSLNSIGPGQMAGYYRLVTCTATGSGAIVLPITYTP